MSENRLMRFITVGLANTVTGLLVIFACKSALGMDDIAANLAGYAVGIVMGFLLNRNWTFGYSTDKQTATFVRYLTVLCVAYGANLMTTLQAINLLHLNSYLAQTAGVLPYTVIGYLGNRYFVFLPVKEKT
jgi:putative flippase GtrA